VDASGRSSKIRCEIQASEKAKAGARTGEKTPAFFRCQENRRKSYAVCAATSMPVFGANQAGVRMRGVVSFHHAAH